MITKTEEEVKKEDGGGEPTIIIEEEEEEEEEIVPSKFDEVATQLTQKGYKQYSTSYEEKKYDLFYNSELKKAAVFVDEEIQKSQLNKSATGIIVSIPFTGKKLNFDYNEISIKE